MNNKTPGLNKVPPNAFKAMDTNILQHHLNFISELWKRTIDFFLVVL